MARLPSAPHRGVFARIGPSRLHGVGVIAVLDIPAGTLVFAGEDERAVWVRRSYVRRLPPAVRALYEDFGMVDGPWLGVPKNLNRLSAGWYVNHSERPNLVAGDDGRFRSLRRIRAGEELTADYRTFADEPLPFRSRTRRAPPQHRCGERGHMRNTGASQAPLTICATTLGANGIASGYGFVDLPYAFRAERTGTRIAAQWVLPDH